MMSPAQETAYRADNANMAGRFVIFDGEVWIVQSVYYPGNSPGGIHYLLSQSGRPFFQVAYPDECASCLF